MPGARWFPGSLLNYAEHAVRGAGAADRDIAVHARSQTRPDLSWTWGELRDQVARARRVLVDLGVGPGDRVAGYLPNCPEALVAFLAAAGLGAVWTSCAIEFGPRSVIDRFGQVEPVVLLVAGGYRYGRKDVDRGAEVEQVVRALPSVRHVLDIEYGAWRVDLRRVVAPAPRRGHRPDHGDHPGAVRPPVGRPVLLRHDREAEGDRARARGDPARAPQEPRAVLGPRSRRRAALVLDHRLDDVERARLRPARRRDHRDDRRRPGVPRPRLAVAAGRGDRRDADGREPGFRDGLPLRRAWTSPGST